MPIRNNRLTGSRREGLSDDGRVTACLLSWRRPENIALIVRGLLEIEFIDEILIWNNNPEAHLQFDDPSIRVIDSDENFICYGRYLCAAEARNSVIYVQDDDALNNDIPGLYRSFLANPDRITHALTPAQYQWRDRQVYGDAHNALVGWGAFFRKEWLTIFDDLPESVFESPLLLREADKFFTMLLGGRHNTVLGDISHLHGHSKPGLALWRDPSHRRQTGLAIHQALRLLRLHENPASPPPFNVVIPCYNYGRFLDEALESVLASDADYEVHIVDDASTDETSEVAAFYVSHYPQIHYLRNETRRGPGYSRNRGVSAVESSFVVLLDGDDLIGPNYLFEAAIKLMAGADVVNPDATLFGAAEGRWLVADLTTLDMLLERNSVHCCSAFRRGLWFETGGIDEQISRWMDYEFWIRLAAAGARIEGLHGDHFFYRQHEHSLSRSAAFIRRELRSYIRQKHADLFAAAG